MKMKWRNYRRFSNKLYTSHNFIIIANERGVRQSDVIYPKAVYTVYRQLNLPDLYLNINEKKLTHLNLDDIVHLAI